MLPTKTSRRWSASPSRSTPNATGKNQAAIVTKWLKVGVDCARSLTKPGLPLTIALQQSLATTNDENKFLTHSRIYYGS